jgi:large subunit ribosomal protein L18
VVIKETRRSKRTDSGQDTGDGQEASSFAPLPADAVRRSRELRVDRLTVFRSEPAHLRQHHRADGDRCWSAPRRSRPRCVQGRQSGRRQHAAAALVGKRIAEKALALGIEAVAFDRAGFRFTVA